MKILPILFNTEMVRALQDGRKTVTRRVIKPQPPIDYRYSQADDCEKRWFWTDRDDDDDMMGWWPSYYNGLIPPYRPGDILYVRETWCPYDKDHVIDGKKYAYGADATGFSEPVRKAFGYKWCPSIHMPKEAARIFLRVTDVRVEELHEITEEQAREEGVGDPYDYQTPEWYEAREELAYSSEIAAFAGLWDSTMKPADRDEYGWGANPWVWVISFERVDKPEEWTNDRPGI